MGRTALTIAALGLVLAGCDRAKQNEVTGPIVNARKGAVLQNVGETPMAERVAVIGLLNKRNGIVRNLTMKPGEALRLRDVIVRLRACETTAPWESPPLTGAFLQLDIEQTSKEWRRVFSGWLYKESPSLNVVESPLYDVWPKSCTMSWPGAPVAPAAAAPAERTPSKASSAKKSADAPSDPAAPAVAPDEPSPPPSDPSATPSNRT